jgi:hypothetical protein
MTEPEIWEIVMGKLDCLSEDVMNLSIAVSRMEESLRQTAALQEKHQHLLRGGNGDGLGLVATVAAIKKTAEEDHRLLVGSEDKPGLKGKVQRLNDQVGAIYKVLWIVLGAALGTIVSLWVTVPAR